jgi:hypothetical protein
MAEELDEALDQAQRFDPRKGVFKGFHISASIVSPWLLLGDEFIQLADGIGHDSSLTWFWS